MRTIFTVPIKVIITIILLILLLLLLHKLAAPLAAAALSGGVDVQLSKKEKQTHIQFFL